MTDKMECPYCKEIELPVEGGQCENCGMESYFYALYFRSAFSCFQSEPLSHCIEPVDEPKTVWVTFDKNGETISHWESEVEAICDLDLNTITRAYAEFQQVGPMVRRERDDG